MAETIQLWAILIAVLGVLVTLIIALLKFNRNSVTKEDLTSLKADLTSAFDRAIEALRLDMNKRFEEVDRRFEEAATERKEIKEEAAADRQLIRTEMSNGFDHARDERKAIKEEAAADRQLIRTEMSKGFDHARVDRQLIRMEMSKGFDHARDERKAIEGEIIRQNQNYIEHLAHHNTKKVNPNSEEDDST